MYAATQECAQRLASKDNVGKPCATTLISSALRPTSSPATAPDTCREIQHGCRRTRDSYLRHIPAELGELLPERIEPEVLLSELSMKMHQHIGRLRHGMHPFLRFGRLSSGGIMFFGLSEMREKSKPRRKMYLFLAKQGCDIGTSSRASSASASRLFLGHDI